MTKNRNIFAFYSMLFLSIISILSSAFLNLSLVTVSNASSIILENECIQKESDFYEVKIVETSDDGQPMTLRINSFISKKYNINVEATQSYPGLFVYSQSTENLVFNFCDTGLILEPNINSYIFVSDLGFVAGTSTILTTEYNHQLTKISISKERALSILGKSNNDLTKEDLIKLGKMEFVINDGFFSYTCSVYSVFDLSKMDEYVTKKGKILDETSIAIHDSNFKTDSYNVFLVTKCGRIRSEMLFQCFNGYESFFENDIVISQNGNKIKLNENINISLKEFIGNRYIFIILFFVSILVVAAIYLLNIFKKTLFFKKNYFTFIILFFLVELIKCIFAKNTFNTYIICSSLIPFELILILPMLCLFIIFSRKGKLND